ncbi:hypothetical protein ACVIRO_004319 [Rhizobium ruizarguesonis]
MTLKARVIPCLDVKDGRVVKGVNFLNLSSMPAIPSKPRKPTMRRAPMNSASSTSPLPRTIARRSSMSCRARPTNASCR